MIKPNFINWSPTKVENIDYNWYGSGWLEWDGKIVNKIIIDEYNIQLEKIKTVINNTNLEIINLDNDMNNSSNESSKINELINEKTLIFNFLNQKTFYYSDFIKIIEYYCDNVQMDLNYNLTYLRNNLNTNIYNEINIYNIIEHNKYINIKLTKYQKKQVDDF